MLTNPLPANNLNSIEQSDWGDLLYLHSDGVQPGNVNYGNVTLATDAGNADDISVSWQQYWFRGAWFDNLEVYWNDLKTPGPLKNRVYTDGAARGSGPRFNKKDEGVLAVHVPVQPGERVRYAL
ncbi:MAG: hypothetical protein R2867_03490 [Caldilineaceae bacterium]